MVNNFAKVCKDACFSYCIRGNKHILTMGNHFILIH